MVSPLVVRSLANDAPAGFENLFNGKDLTNWKGLEGFWSVKDGEIVGQATKEKSKQTFLVYQGDKPKDFELHLKFKFVTPDGNSGIQFRSKMLDETTSKVGGYQADFDATNGYTGIIYDEAGVAGKRGIMSKRGEKTHWGQGEKPDKVEPLELNDAELKKAIKVGEWNDVVLTVQGNHFTYKINGHTTTDLTDEHADALNEGGLIALQMHAGFTQEIHFKDIYLKKM
jgi:hypothetical protein